MSWMISLAILVIACNNLVYSGVIEPSDDIIFNERKILFEKQKCEKITVPMCRDLDYNLTTMPNQFNHESQADAAMEAHQFWPLVEINCAKDLKFFLCSMYTPICVENYSKQIKACKSVCQRVRIGCEKFLKKYGFDWPEFMNCDLFPEYGSTKDVCMDPVDAILQKGDEKNNKIENKVVPTQQVENEINSRKESKSKDKLCQQNCVQPCYSSYLSESERLFCYYWILALSLLCFVSSMITTITYFIEKSRFKYPEKPIIYLSVCYLFVSIGYLIKYMLRNDKIACELDGSIKQFSSSEQTNTSCALIFILIYYFGMAGTIWWVIISLTWFLAAGLKWSIEAIAKYNHYFHMIAWLIPTITTVIILTLGLVDGDSMSGICYVGNSNIQSMRIFVIAPALITLLIGIGFLLLGFISLFRLRNIIKQQQNQGNTNKLENLMLRIGIFAVLYTVPTTFTIAIQFYEQYYRIEWENYYICQENGLLNKELAPDSPCFAYSNSTVKRPEFFIFMLKYFMHLIVGILSGFWIWTPKTLNSWYYFLKKFVCFSQNKQDLDKFKTKMYFKANQQHCIENNNINDPNKLNVYQFPIIIQDNNDHESNYYNISPNENSDQFQKKCHTNKAAAFYCDCSSTSTKTERLASSSKYSIPSSISISKQSTN